MGVKKKIGISGCMIVKDESRQLGKALDSLSSVCDEIILVDTGSIDNTKKIAKSYGCRVFDYVWDHHYGRARNFSFSKACYNWILYIDGDEQLSDIAIYWVSEVFRFDNIDDISKMYSFPIKDLRFPYAGGNKGVIRLFPNGRFYFDEHISGDRSSSGQKIVTSLYCIHTGYPILHDQLYNCHAYKPEKLLRRIADDLEANNGLEYDRFKIFCDGCINSVKEFYKRFWKKKGYRDGKRGLSWILMRCFHYFTRGFLLAVKCREVD